MNQTVMLVASAVVGFLFTLWILPMQPGDSLGMRVTDGLISALIVAFVVSRWHGRQ